MARLILDYLSEQAPKLYDLDWVEHTKAYKEATSIAMQSEVTYRKFLASKLQLQKQRALQILGVKSTWLVAGGATIALGGWKGYELCEHFNKRDQTAKVPSPPQVVAPKDQRPPRRRSFAWSWSQAHASQPNGTKKKNPNQRGFLASLLPDNLINIPIMDYVRYGPGVLLATLWGLLLWSGEELAEVSFIKLGQRIISSCTYLIQTQSPTKDPYSDIEELYVKNYFLLKTTNPQLLMGLKKKMAALRTISPSEYNDYLAYVETACRLPLKIGEFCVDTNKFEKTYQFYSSSVRETLKHITLELCTQESVRTDNEIRFPFYFQGPPGVGKTYAVNHITHVTGASICHVSLEGSSIQEIIGTKNEPGKLLTALTRDATHTANNCKNSILFLDEFDHLINDQGQGGGTGAMLSFILKVLDPNNLKFFSPYLDCYVDLPRVIILAGNQIIRDPALQDRFQIVYFNGYERGERWAIAEATIIPKIAKMYGFHHITEEDLTNLKEIIYQDTKRHGMRSVEITINNYFAQKRTQQQF